MKKISFVRTGVSLSAALFLLLVALLAGPVTASAVPACPDPYTHIQPNKEQITVYKRGDEFLHWEEDEKGFLLVRESETYYYATWTDKGPKATSTAASNRSLTHPGSMASNIPQAVIEKADTIKDENFTRSPGTHSQGAKSPGAQAPTVNANPQRNCW